eukprot:Skav230022  [mRNA]  locus=scaffold769:361010:361775:- [translate_table: standard]
MTGHLALVALVQLEKTDTRKQPRPTACSAESAGDGVDYSALLTHVRCLGVTKGPSIRRASGDGHQRSVAHRKASKWTAHICEDVCEGSSQRHQTCPWKSGHRLCVSLEVNMKVNARGLLQELGNVMYSKSGVPMRSTLLADRCGMCLPLMM